MDVYGRRMAGSPRAANAAVHLPKDYRVILPSLPAGEALRRAAVHHCDAAVRPYGMNYFAKAAQGTSHH
ncbi:hypothetical protein HPB50_024446 [Hyalomma asiaticum]|uniref:Uncharacterized protein n=1 Tax=Hyalomma asiaticum TaxID=266040 RepID=A0ACB7T4M6_HYAAI|nr:hypothetical protein HPB50_024446 [Hyalomma asiaticum]